MKTNHPGFRLSEYDRVRVTCDPVGKSLTKQSFANDCDINVIMGRVEKSGTYPMVQGQPFFGDFSDRMSYHDAMNRVLERRACLCSCRHRCVPSLTTIRVSFGFCH